MSKAEKAQQKRQKAKQFNQSPGQEAGKASKNIKRWN